VRHGLVFDCMSLVKLVFSLKIKLVSLWDSHIGITSMYDLVRGRLMPANDTDVYDTTVAQERSLLAVNKLFSAEGCPSYAYSLLPSLMEGAGGVGASLDARLMQE
jgi:hypothetical protein